MSFWRLVFSFVSIYKWKLLFYILLNVLCSIVNIFSFSAIIPLLYILFGLSNPNMQIISWCEIDSISSFMDVLKNNILFYLQEQIVQHGTISALFIVCFVFVTTSFLSNVISYLAYFVRIPVRTGIARDLRTSIYDKLLLLPTNLFEKRKKGDFIGRMTTDIEEVDFGIGTTMDMLIKYPIEIVMYIIALFGISIYLASYATMLLVIVCFFVGFIGYYMKEISLKGQSLKGQLISAYEESIEKNIVIKVFNLFSYFYEKFQRLNNLLRVTHNKMNRVYSIAYPLTDFLSVVVMAIMLLVGGIKVIHNELNIDAAELIYFIIIFHSIISPIRYIIKSTYGIRKAMASLERINHILGIDLQENIELRESSWELSKLDKIKFESVSFSYCPGNEIFHNLNIDIPIGESTIILGPNGKGKSTLIKLLLKLEVGYTGDISIGEKNIKEVSSNSLIDLFSYVPQDSLLFNDTIYNNIALGRITAKEEDVYSVAKLVGLHDFIISTKDGYSSIVGELGMSLSGGQKQCISIARALLKDAPILILDEATSGIDKDTELMIVNNIQKLLPQKTLIVISHSAVVIDKISNHIIL